MEKDYSFFARIDETGGWPVGYDYVGFEHSDARRAGFTKAPVSHGWWTTLSHADDYYLWKVSPAGKRRFAEAIVHKVRYSVTCPSVERIAYQGWDGMPIDLPPVEKSA
jgi:hypothetical protein